MRLPRHIFLSLFTLLLIILVGGGLLWANLIFTQSVPGGEDFIVPWKAIQNFMMDGVTPYGDLTSINIQSIIYQHPLLPGQYPYRVNLPFFMLMLFLPFGWIKDLNLARSVWMMLLEVGLVWLVIVCLRLIRWKPHRIFLIFILLFSVFWLPSVSMLVTATPIILQALVFCSALRSIGVGSDEFAGILVGLTLLNIEATGLVFLTLIIWIFSTQRWRVLGGIVMTLTILLSLSLIMSPSWIMPFIGSTVANWRSGALPSTYRLFEDWLPGIGHRLAQIIAIAALTIIFLEWRAVRKQNVRWLFWTICVTAALTPLVGLPYFPKWLVFTLPGVLLVVSEMSKRWGALGLGGSIGVMLGLFFGLWSAQVYGLISVFILFYPVILTLLLYWVRWGAVRPPRLWADEIMLRG